MANSDVYNLQGDVIALTDNNGSVVVAYSYDAWGKPLCVTGTLAATLGRLNPFRYRGYVWDEETGLYYLRSRYYRAEWGRFINEDNLILCDDLLWDCKAFTYCTNNPVSIVDPNGTSFWDVVSNIGKALIAIGVVVVGVAVAIAITAGTGGMGTALAVGGSGTIAHAAVTAVAGAGVLDIASGVTIYTISESERRTEEEIRSSRQHKGNPRNNQSQNKMFDEAINRLKRQGVKMTKERIEQLHHAIYHHDYGLEEIIEEGVSMFGD